MNDVDAVERWVRDMYGAITFSAVVTPFFEVHTAVVPLNVGVEIGMGQTKILAIHDLYEALCQRPSLQTELTGFWRDRRNKIKEGRSDV